LFLPNCEKLSLSRKVFLKHEFFTAPFENRLSLKREKSTMDELLTEISDWMANANVIADFIGLVILLRKLIRWVMLKWF